ncbi:MAG: Bax protein [Limisphaerales bacterium]|jgi:Bax protein
MHTTNLPLLKRNLHVIAVFLMVVLFGSGIWLTQPVSVPAFAELPTIAEKKQAFFSYLTPYVETVNLEVSTHRSLAENLYKTSSSGSLNWFQRFQANRLASLYLPDEFRSEHNWPAQLTEVTKRAGQIPTGLALAQAAKESGWGSSRFARLGYNFFGQHCFNRGCGFTPKRRATGLRNEVAKFASPKDAVRAYIHNLNTHPRYDRFRAIRWQLTSNGDRPKAKQLAAGLVAYSERGQPYVDEIVALIKTNKLD